MKSSLYHTSQTYIIEYHIIANSRPGVYKIDCKCGEAKYLGETKKMVVTRVIEHERDVSHGRWEKSGLTGHAKNCNEVFELESAKTLATEGNYRKRKLQEALEIRRNETGPRQAFKTFWKLVNWHFRNS